MENTRRFSFSNHQKTNQKTISKLSKLTPSHSLTHDDLIEHLKELESLTLSKSSLRNFKKIENHLNLKFLSLDVSSLQSKANFSVKNIPNLEQFILEGNLRVMDTETDFSVANSKFVVSTFPKLERISLFRLDFPVVLGPDIPKVRALSTKRCVHVDFKKKEDIPCSTLEEMILNNSRLGIVLLTELKNKSFKNLKIVDHRSAFDNLMQNFGINDFRYEHLASLEKYTHDARRSERAEHATAPLEAIHFNFEVNISRNLTELKLLDFKGIFSFNGRGVSKLRKVGVFMGGCLLLQNHPVLKIVIFAGSFRLPAVIEDCPELTSVRINPMKESKIVNVNNDRVVVLKNLPKCRYLRIFDFGRFKNENLKITNCGIRSLSLVPKKRGSYDETGEPKENYCLDITKKKFPFLEFLEVDTGSWDPAAGDLAGFDRIRLLQKIPRKFFIIGTRHSEVRFYKVLGGKLFELPYIPVVIFDEKSWSCVKEKLQLSRVESESKYPTVLLETYIDRIT